MAKDEPAAQQAADEPEKGLEQRLQTSDRDLKAAHKRMGDQDAQLGKVRSDAKTLREERDALKEELEFLRTHGADEQQLRAWESDRAVKRATTEHALENRRLSLQVKMRDYKDEFGIPLNAMEDADDEKDLALKVALWRLDNRPKEKEQPETPPPDLRTAHPGATDQGAIPTTAFRTKDSLQDAWISGKIPKDVYKQEAARLGLNVPP